MQLPALGEIAPKRCDLTDSENFMPNTEGAVTNPASTQTQPFKLSDNPDVAAGQIGTNLNSAQSNLMTAYSMTDATASDQALSDLAKALGYKADGQKLNVKTLQLVAEQRFQQSSSVATLFSNLLEKMDQLRQRIIGNIGR